MQSTAGVAELSSRLVDLQQKLEWIAFVLEGEQTCEGRELAGLRNEANWAISSEMAYQPTFTENLQDQESCIAEAEQSISSASQTFIDDLGRRTKELPGMASALSEATDLAQLRTGGGSHQSRTKFAFLNLNWSLKCDNLTLDPKNEVGTETELCSIISQVRVSAPAQTEVPQRMMLA